MTCRATQARGRARTAACAARKGLLFTSEPHPRRTHLPLPRPRPTGRHHHRWPCLRAHRLAHAITCPAFYVAAAPRAGRCRCSPRRRAVCCGPAFQPTTLPVHAPPTPVSSRYHGRDRTVGWEDTHLPLPGRLEWDDVLARFGARAILAASPANAPPSALGGRAEHNIA